MPNTITIHDGNFKAFLNVPGKGYGLKKRDFAAQPMCSSAATVQFPPSLLIPESDWPALIAQKNAEQSWLDDIRNVCGPGGGRIPSRDQGQSNFCWAHSSTSAMLLQRAMEGLPYADLSAFAVACMIMNFQNNGGNGIDSLEFIANRGVPTSQFWPQQSWNHANNNANTWANAALNKAQVWFDCDPSMSKQILVSCALRNIPVVGDYNWWSHSVGSGLRVVSLNPFTMRIWNSWGDSWSNYGMGDLVGSKAIPDGLCCPLVAYASVD